MTEVAHHRAPFLFLAAAETTLIFGFLSGIVAIVKSEMFVFILQD